MAGELESLRADLEASLESAWSSAEATGFAQDLKSAFPNGARAAFEECAATAANFAECLEREADEAGVGSSAESAWDGVPDGLLTQVRQVRSKWTNEAKDTVRDIARNADLSELNRLCATGEYSEVSDQANLDTTPSNFGDCVAEVAAAKDLRGKLKGAWGTA